MVTLNIASKANQATTFPALLVAYYAKESDPNASINVIFEEAEALKSGDKASVELVVGSRMSRFGFENAINGLITTCSFLQGKHEELVREWLARTASFFPTDFKPVEGPLHELDAYLTLRSHIVGYALTVADLSVWGGIRGNKVAYAAVKKGDMLNISRWFKFVNETNPWIAEAITLANAQAQAKKSAKSSEGASYDIALPDTDKGVVTRFPPEPS